MTEQSPAVTVGHPPEALLKAVNPMLRFLLRTPLAGPLRNQLMVLNFKGRKSGRQFSIPVSAHRIDGTSMRIAEAPWKHNFRDGATAEVLHDGKTTTMRGELITDPAVVADLSHRCAESYGVKKRADHDGTQVPRSTGSPQSRSSPRRSLERRSSRSGSPPDRGVKQLWHRRGRRSVSRKRIVIAGLGDSGVLTAIRLARHADVIGISAKPALVSGQELGWRLSRPDHWATSQLDSVRPVPCAGSGAHRARHSDWSRPRGPQGLRRA